MAMFSSPVYCMTMAARQDRMGLRLDVLVLFLWVMTGLAAAAFYLYAAALLVCRIAKAEDIRPIGAMLVLGSMSMVLLFNFDSDAVLFCIRLAYRWGYLLFVLPLGTAWVRSLLQGRQS